MIKYNKKMLGYVQENLDKFCEDCKSIILIKFSKNFEDFFLETFQNFQYVMSKSWKNLGT